MPDHVLTDDDVLTDEVLLADRELAGIAGRMQVLLAVTPVNGEAAWVAWTAGGGRGAPSLEYRASSVHPDDIRRELDAVPLDAVEDPVVHRLLAAKADELALEADLLEHRGTPRFLEVSRELYGTADDDLVALARQLLDRLEPDDPDVEVVAPEAFAAEAEEELERYRERGDVLQGTVVVRSDVPSLMVVQREFYVGTDSFVPAHRVQGLVQHEVGTHLLTAQTGGAQPLRLLEQGLAHYEETQEALALLAEHLAGGLDASRLRVLAGRALAVRALTDGADFDGVMAALTAAGVDERVAWTIAVRVVRGGGFTKDVVYLRGLAELVRHLAAGGALESLLVGKLHLDQVTDVEDLLARGVLHPPSLRPRWLDLPGAEQRLAAIRSGESVLGAWG